jgi:dTDP-4-amino-4,6-dideoxygalactose transaminase
MTALKKIPFFDYPGLFKQREQELMGVIQDVCARGAYILQKDLRDFEENLKEFLGVKHVFGVADGTNALIIGLKAIDLKPGDEVIIPSHTYIASAASVHLLGGVPVLAEIGPDHMLDPKAITSLITSKTKAIMPVQVNGRTCNMDAIQAIADEYGLKIVEDAAQGLGSKFKGKCAGTFGAFGTFSFYPAKVLGCFGDGGAIVTNDDEVADYIYCFRDHGRDKEGNVIMWGTNSRLDNLQAAILNHKLKTYHLDIERRRDIAARYHEGLKHLPDLILPPAPGEDPHHFDVYQNYELEAGQRNALRKHLDQAGIHTIIQWAGTPVHQFKELGFTQSLPITEKFFERCFMLPMNTVLNDADVDYIIHSINRFYKA